MKNIFLKKFWLVVLLVTTTCTTANSAGINDTGITSCSDTSGTQICSSLEKSFPNQDAMTGRDAARSGFSFTKISNSGQSLDSSAVIGSGSNDWACTLDNVSGLLWEVKNTETSSTQVKDSAGNPVTVTVLGLRHMNNTYSWYEKSTNSSNYTGFQSYGSCKDTGRCDTSSFSADVNKTGLCGFKDWRLPTIKEIENIVDFSQIKPSINRSYFPNTMTGQYWTSTDFSQSPGQYAWALNFGTGAAVPPSTTKGLPVRLVRGVITPPNNFSSNNFRYLKQVSDTAAASAHTAISTNAIKQNALLAANAALLRATTADVAADIATAQAAKTAAQNAANASASDMASKVVDAATAFKKVSELTVTDNQNSLMWKAFHEMVDLSWDTYEMPDEWITRVNRFLDWQGALQRAINDKTGNFTDWRLPNVKELRTIINENMYIPAINKPEESYFLPTPYQGAFWTSSPALDIFLNTNTSWIVNFDAGGNSNSYRGSRYYVRLVRNLKLGDPGYVTPATGQWLLVGATGTGRGTLKGNNLDCNAVATIISGICSNQFNQNVRITAAVTGKSLFKGWTGACQGASPTCDVAMTEARTVQAIFDKAPQSIGNIQLPSPPKLDLNGTVVISAVATSDLPVSFTSDTPTICEVTGTKVTGRAMGTCTITAKQAGNEDYVSAPEVKGYINVGSTASQTISDFTFSPESLSVYGSTTVNANASSTLSVTFESSTPTVCSVSGTTVLGLKPGTCTVKASQTGDVNYTAVQETKSIDVTDSAVFTNNRNSYTITKAGSVFQVKDASGVVKSLPTDVTEIKFADVSVNLPIGDLSKLIAVTDLNSLIELYVAFFNRVPEADGLEYWINQSKNGMTMDQISNSFYTAAIEYTALTGYTSTMSDEDFVRKIYSNVLGRSGSTAPPSGDVNYWVGQYTTGSLNTKGKLVQAMLTSAHTFAGDITWGWVPQLLNNKISVAQLFAIQQGLNYNTPEDSITKGMAIAAAVTSESVPAGTAAAIKLMNIADTVFNLTP